MNRNLLRSDVFVAAEATSELVLHIITRPYGGRFEVCRIVPGECPVSVGAFDSHEEALAVRTKLDMMNDNDPAEEPVPEEFDDLLCRI